MKLLLLVGLGLLAQVAMAADECERLERGNASRRIASGDQESQGADWTQFPETPRQIPDDELSKVIAKLRPRGKSYTGFISPTDDLKVILATDEATVRRRGRTHQQIAMWMQKLIDAGRLNPHKPTRVTIDGVTYDVKVTPTRGIQESPFGDELKWNSEVEITNVANGKTIKVSDGHPYLIGFYGFYEGNVKYRVSPDAIIDMMEGK